MAEQNTKSDGRISKALRQLKVGYVSIRHESRKNITATRYSRCPSLSLKGQWLAEAGFVTDTPVIVSVEQGQLVIRAVDQ